MIDLKEILSRFSSKRLLVIGDIMLDQYIWGRVERISPEAPVPVLDVQKEEYRLGGAANVALNLKALEAEVFLCGYVGKDEAGDRLLALLDEKGIDTGSIVVDNKRPTTRKTRIGATTQQIVRIDYENRQDVSAGIEKKIIAKITKLLSKVDAVIFEDYNKGLLTENIISETIRSANKMGIPVTVDPKQKNFFQYKNVTIFKSNYSELQKNLGVIFENEAEFEARSRMLQTKMKCRYLVVTRGEKGLFIFSDKSKIHKIPTFAREVYDVSGAGDTVISALTLAFSCGCDIETSAIIANHAAGIVCGKMGTATASLEEIKVSYHDHSQNN